MKQKWAIFILIAAGIVAYANTAKNGLFWDDDEFITRNAYIRSFKYLPQWFSQPLTAGAGVNSNYYRPLLMASFTIDYHLWGLWPAGYHFENVLWHITAGILLYFFLLVILSGAKNPVADGNQRDPSPAGGGLRMTEGKIAFATALLWLVHPVHVEAVAYANSRGDSMATAFILLTLILWMKRRFWASAAAFILALLSKEFAIITPGLIVLVEFIKESPWRTPRTLLSKMFPYIVIFFIYLLLRLTVLNFQNTLNFYGASLQKSDFCTQQKSDFCNPVELYAASLPVRLLTFSKVLPIYGRILVWPDDLHMERTVEIATTAADKIALVVAAVVIVILLSCYLAILKNNFIPAFGFGWFFISILPVSGIVPISQILAEHFLYLPSIGFFLIVSAAIAYPTSLSFRAKRSGVEKSSAAISISLSARSLDYARDDGLNDSNHLTFVHLVYWLILLGISIPLTVKTIRQNRVWRDPITFYEYTLARAEPTARVYNNLAMAYADRGEHQKAINNYQLAISLGDVYPNPHYNLGNTFMELGKLDDAEREYRRSLEIDPSFHYATLKLGQMYLDRGKIDEAKKLVCPVFPNQPLCQH